MQCSNCSAELGDDAKFCKNCGTKVEGAAPAPKPKRKRAPAKAAPVAPEAIEKPEAAPPPPPPPTPVCPHCRQPNAGSARFCRYCGGGMDGGLTPPTHVPAPSDYQPVYGGYGEPKGPNRTPWIAAAAVLGIALLAILYYALFLDREAPDTPAASATPAVPIASSVTKVEEQYFVIADANVRDRATSVGTQIVRKENRGSMLRGTVEVGADGSSQWLKLTDGTGFVALSNLSSNQPPRLAQTFNNRPYNSVVDVQLHASPDDNSPVLETIPFGKTLFLAGITDNGYIEAKRTKGGVGYFNAAGIDLSNNYAPAANAAANAVNQPVYSGNDYSYDPSRGISVKYVSYYRSLVGRTGDQQIAITVRNDGSGVAYYTNVNSGKRCTAYLRYTGVYGDYLAFDQNRPPDGNGCGQTPELRLSGTPGDVQADWVMGGNYVMSSGLVPGN